MSTTSVRKLSVIDSAFLYAETVECPMHIGSVAFLKPPAGYDGDFFEDVKARIASRIHLAKSLRFKLAPTPFDIDRPSWIEDEHFDIDRHVFRGALPAPGDRATVLRLSGWMHAKALNRARPLWEVYVYDGLPNGETAMYTKVHHSLVDGAGGAAVTGILYDLTPTPGPAPAQAPDPGTNADYHEVRDLAASMVAAWTQLLKTGTADERAAFELPRTHGTDLVSVLLDAAIHQTEWQLKMAFGFPQIVGALQAALSEALKPGAVKSLAELAAPASALNVSIASERTFGIASLPLARVKAVGAKANATVNDVVLALSAGMLRRYLNELGTLPKRPMTAFVPISAREKGNAEMRNQIFGMVVPLATEIADPKARLETIVAESQRAKGFANPFRSLVPHLIELPTFGTPMLLQLLATFYSRSNLANVIAPPFNLIISNVFVSKKPLYIAGAELLQAYPMSILAHGQALNVTVHGYRDRLDFGLVAASNVIPHLGHVAAMLPEELNDLERALGIPA